MTERPRSAPSLGLRTVRRQLSSQPAVVWSVSIVVLITTFVVAAAPRLLERVSAEDLFATVSEPHPAQRNIEVQRGGRLGAGSGDDPMSAIRRSGDSFAQSEMPRSVTSVISGHHFVVDSPQFSVSPFPGEEPAHPFPMFLRFRYQEQIEDQITFVDGSMPTPQEPVRMLVGAECPETPDERENIRIRLEDGEDLDLGCEIQGVPHHQVAISTETAGAMGLQVGSRILLTPDPNDRLFFGIPGEALQYQLVISISGLFEPSDASNEYWYGDTDLHRPRIQETADLRIIRATGLFTPADYQTLLSSVGEAGLVYSWRHFVEPELVQTAALAGLRADLQGFELEHSPVAAQPTDFTVSTQLSDLLTAHVEQKSQTVAMISLAAAALFSVVVGVILLLAVLMTTRQRAAIVLNRNRGTSGRQLTLTRLYEALILTVPAAALGYVLAVIALPAGDGLASYRATTAVVAATNAALVVAMIPIVRRPLGMLQTEFAPVPTAVSKRLVAETLVVVLAIGSIFVLRRRGQIDDNAAGPTFDALLAVAPALIGVAGGLLTIRLYPVLISGLANLGARARGLTLFVGFRRILEQSLPARLPVLIILICVAAATYTLVAFTSLTQGQLVSSWQVVGADYAIKGSGPNVGLPSSIDLEGLQHEGLALGRTFPNAGVVVESTSYPAEVLAIDADAYERLTKGTLGEVALPDLMLESQPESTGTLENPLPVIVSSTWPNNAGPGIGDRFTLDLGRLKPIAEVREVRDRHPDMPLDTPFVVISLTALETMSELPLPPTVAYLVAPESADSTLAATLSEQAPSARLVSRYETLRAVADDPFVRWVGLTLMIVFGFAVMFGVVAAVSSVGLASARRRRDFGYLRTMGLETAQATALTVIEHLPGVAVATVCGVGVGVATAIALDPAVGLESFTGGLVPAGVVIDWRFIVGLAVTLFGALAASVVIFVVVNRRQDLGKTLRVGDE